MARDDIPEGTLKRHLRADVLEAVRYTVPSQERGLGCRRKILTKKEVGIIYI